MTRINAFIKRWKVNLNKWRKSFLKKTMKCKLQSLSGRQSNYEWCYWLFLLILFSLPCDRCSILESENVSLKASAKLASAAGFGQTTGHPSASDYRHLQSTRSFVQTSYPQGSIPSHDTSRALFPRPTKSADYSDYKARDTSLSNTPHSHDENFFHGNVEELAALPTANFERENVKVSPSRITYKPNASLLQNSTIIKNTNPLMHFQDQNPSLFASPTPRMHGSGNNSGTIHVTGSPRSSTSPAKVRSPAREAQAAAEENVTLLGPKKLSDISRFLNK